MGQTSENVVERYGITRKEQDEFAAESHRRAAAAQAAGKFQEQIVPVQVKVPSPLVPSSPVPFSPVPSASVY